MKSGEIGVEVVEWRRPATNDAAADEDPPGEDPIELPQFRLRLDMEIRVEDEEGNLK